MLLRYLETSLYQIRIVYVSKIFKRIHLATNDKHAEMFRLVLFVGYIFNKEEAICLVIFKNIKLIIHFAFVKKGRR